MDFLLQFLFGCAGIVILMCLGSLVVWHKIFLEGISIHGSRALKGHVLRVICATLMVYALEFGKVIFDLGNPGVQFPVGITASVLLLSFALTSWGLIGACSSFAEWSARSASGRADASGNRRLD